MRVSNGLGLRETDAALKVYGFKHVFGSVDTESAYSVWQKRDIILVRDDRSNVVLAAVALDSYGVAERVAK